MDGRSHARQPDGSDAGRVIARAPERGAASQTDPSLTAKPVYTPDDAAAPGDYDRDLGQPGQYPFTRGIYPSMYRDRLWTMRQ
jgi:methylmalonyl-CoA mutase, N-terminal domain